MRSPAAGDWRTSLLRRFENLNFAPDAPIFALVADSASELLSPEPVNAGIIYGRKPGSDGERRATVG